MSHSEKESFADRVHAIPGGEYLEMCYSCGTCVSKCMVQQKSDPNYNPRRLIRKAVFGLEKEAFSDVTTWLCTACDLCYPACPQKIHISGVILAVRELAQQTGKTSPVKTAKVNEQTCVACGLCAEACPYEAIQLAEKKVPNRGMITVAQVDAGKCMACGLCGAVCRSTSIGIEEDFSDDTLMTGLWRWLNPVAEVTP
ncbi:MAG: 4Fe-4S binding protein [Chloroflexi bacterium]|nr:4Fe-4S binding protein [Chloroflexota bacterium]